MDRRIIFVLVFFFTLTSTLLVGAVSLLSGQSWLTTALYSLATMWIMGIISQLVIQHLYLGIVKPMDDAKFDEMVEKETSMEIDLDEVEEIDQMVPPSSKEKK